MYKAFYGLSFDPFTKEVINKNFYKSYHFNQALSRLDFLKQHKGFGLITGEPGTGKSSLVRYFKESLNQSQESIFNYSSNKNITPIIILDEVQFLKNSVLDDLRIIFNFQMDSKDLALVLLTGQTNFINQINRSNHEALRQRISVSYHMEGLTSNEVKDYVLSRLGAAGCNEPIFEDDCYELIYTMTNGQFRQINSLARICLIAAASKGSRTISKEDLFQAQKEASIITD